MAPVLRRVSQATFDECVQQNIDDFEMDPAEAVEEAVKEFELQGVDLSEIDRTYAGPEGRGEHPVVPLTLALVSAVEAAERDPAAIDAAVAAMAPHVGAKDSAVPGWGAACVGAGAVQAAFRLCVDEAAAFARAREEEEEPADGEGENAAVSSPSSPTSSAAEARLASALALLASVLACDEARDTFAALGYPAAFLADAWPSSRSSVEPSKSSVESSDADASLVDAAACAAIAQACAKCEANKGAFAKARAEVRVASVFADASASAAALRAACDATRALTTGDDPRDPASGAFQHARAFHAAGACRSLSYALARAVKAAAGGSSDGAAGSINGGGVGPENDDASSPASSSSSLVAALASALRQTSANDAACEETSREGGLHAALDFLGAYADFSGTPPAGDSDRSSKTAAGADLRRAAPSAARACASLVRKLAGSDAVKAAAVKAGGVETLSRAIQSASERIARERSVDETETAAGDETARSRDADESDSKTNGKVAQVQTQLRAQEQMIGALAAVCLKNPSGASSVGASGALDAVADAAHRAPAHAGIQRAACLFARNAVSRCPDNVALALRCGFEPLLRDAKRRHPRECVDVGSAALRDLGCDNYNEGYAPTTAVMGADGVVRTPEELGEEPGSVEGRRAIAGFGAVPE